jgi:hypothetical protein
MSSESECNDAPSETEVLITLANRFKQNHYQPKSLNVPTVPIVVPGAADWFNAVYLELTGPASLKWLPVIRAHCQYSISPFFSDAITFQEGEDACAAKGYKSAVGSKPVFPRMSVPDVNAEDGKALTVAMDAATYESVVSIPLLVNLYSVKRYGGVPAIAMMHSVPTLHVTWTPEVAAAIDSGDMQAHMRVYEHAMSTSTQRYQDAAAVFSLEPAPRLGRAEAVSESALLVDGVFGYGTLPEGDTFEESRRVVK